jgi:hypothetical protein
MGTVRFELAGAGTQTTALGFGGYVLTAGYTNATEEYDGSAWTAGGNLGTVEDNLGGAGLQTAGLAFGGFTGSNTNATEEYDGSAWTGGGNLGTTRRSFAGCRYSNCRFSSRGIYNNTS